MRALVIGGNGFIGSHLVDALPAEPVFNLGGSRTISLLGLVEEIENLVGKKARLDFQAGRKFDAREILLDCTRAKQALGWAPLERGLARTWEWMHITFAENHESR